MKKHSPADTEPFAGHKKNKHLKIKDYENSNFFGTKPMLFLFKR